MRNLTKSEFKFILRLDNSHEFESLRRRRSAVHVCESQCVAQVDMASKGIIEIRFRFRFRNFFAQLNGFASLMLSAVLPHVKFLTEDCAHF